ncbi:thioredoxin family protein [Maribacter algicola]|uniref:Thioredoxin family protein n=1 Tax=Meishania litoralis TaxID=3434685 RepID=A0ACC7LJI2_9FLAO
MSEQYVHLKSTQKLIEEALLRAIKYDEYRKMVSQMAQDGRSTGPKQTEALANYTILNDRRMKRFDKTFKIKPEYAEKIKGHKRKVIWLVLTESWCGDAAPSLPVMNKMAELNPNIDFKVALRDENIELMDRFRYNETLSIPKLIMTDKTTGEILGDWGPRPSTATKMAEKNKKEHGKLTAEFKEGLQVWYNKDKGQNILDDLIGLLLK